MNNWVIGPRNKQIKAGEVDIWRADLGAMKADQAGYRVFLSPDEKERADRFYFEKHRRRFILARGILRSLLSQYLSIEPSAVEFSYGEQGKPSISDQRLQFNTSHTEDYAVYAFTLDHPIGIDIEYKKQRNLLDLAKRFFHLDEYQSILALPSAEQGNAFFHIWTQKEAFIKAIALGLSYPLDKFQVSTTPPAQLITLEDGCDTSAWSLSSFTPFPETEAAFASMQKELVTTYYCYE